MLVKPTYKRPGSEITTTTTKTSFPDTILSETFIIISKSIQKPISTKSLSDMRPLYLPKFQNSYQGLPHVFLQ